MLPARQCILVHDGKGYLVSVAGFKVAGQAVDGGKGTRLGMYISVGKGAFLHAELQCTVHAANGQSLIKFLKTSVRE